MSIQETEETLDNYYGEYDSSISRVYECPRNICSNLMGISVAESSVCPIEDTIPETNNNIHYLAIGDEKLNVFEIADVLAEPTGLSSSFRHC